LQDASKISIKEKYISGFILVSNYAEINCKGKQTTF
jgi:hypothetical protein